MRWRLLPLIVVLAALAVAALDLGALAGHALIAAVAVAAVAAACVFGELVELPAEARGRWYARIEVVLAAAGLVCVLVAALARGHAADAAVPGAAVPGLLAALAIYGMQALTSLVAPTPRSG